MNGLAAIIGIIICIIVVVMVVSIPFAFLGWCLVTFLSLFMDFGDFGWWGYAGTGLATSVVVAWLDSFRS